VGEMVDSLFLTFLRVDSSKVLYKSRKFSYQGENYYQVLAFGLILFILIRLLASEKRA